MLNGTKSLVLHGQAADRIVVSARTAGGSREKDGIGLFLVRADASGLARRGYPTQDGLRGAEITLKNLRIEPTDVIGDPEGSFPVIARVADDAIAAICAEAVGCVTEMLAITLAYLKTREQFGRTIGSFQVLQHRAVDMFIELERSCSMAMYATMMMDEDDANERAMSAEGANRPVREGDWPTSDPAPRRHRHDHGLQHRPLFQACDHDRHAVRRC